MESHRARLQQAVKEKNAPSELSIKHPFIGKKCSMAERNCYVRSREDPADPEMKSQVPTMVSLFFFNCFHRSSFSTSCTLFSLIRFIFFSRATLHFLTCHCHSYNNTQLRVIKFSEVLVESFNCILYRK